MSRAQDTLDARAAADQWAGDRELPPSGGYSGTWYLNGYLNGFWPDSWPKWWADYSQPAGEILGDDIVGHQFSASPIDQDVMLDSEIVTVTDEERQQMQDQINGLISALGLLCGDDLKPLTRSNASAYVKTYVGQARAIAKQFGVNHA